MKKINIFILILLHIIFAFGYTQEADTGPQETSVGYCGYIDAPENIKVDNNLDFTSIRIQSYKLTEKGQRLGGFASILLSSRELSEEANQYIYGGLSGGVLIGQEIEFWRITLGINLQLGAGLSIFNITESPRHIDFFSELSADIGLRIKEELKLIVFGGFQCIGNLLPKLPGTDYLMYYPVWGIAFSWGV